MFKSSQCCPVVLDHEIGDNAGGGAGLAKDAIDKDQVLVAAAGMAQIVIVILRNDLLLLLLRTGSVESLIHEFGGVHEESDICKERENIKED